MAEQRDHAEQGTPDDVGVGLYRPTGGRGYLWNEAIKQLDKMKAMQVGPTVTAPPRAELDGYQFNQLMNYGTQLVWAVYVAFRARHGDRTAAAFLNGLRIEVYADDGRKFWPVEMGNLVDPREQAAWTPAMMPGLVSFDKCEFFSDAAGTIPSVETDHDPDQPEIR